MNSPFTTIALIGKHKNPEIAIPLLNLAEYLTRKNHKILLDHLTALSPGHAAALADREAIRIAIGEDFVGLEAPLAGAREIAIFPPVTGG